MRKVFCALVALFPWLATAQTHVLFTLSEFNATPTTNRTVTVQPMTPFRGNLTSYSSSTNGYFYASNMAAGDYDCVILKRGTANEIAFQVTVTSASLGVINAASNTSVRGVQSYPVSGKSAWTILASEARYGAASISDGTLTTNKIDTTFRTWIEGQDSEKLDRSNGSSTNQTLRGDAVVAATTWSVTGDGNAAFTTLDGGNLLTLGGEGINSWDDVTNHFAFPSNANLASSTNLPYAGLSTAARNQIETNAAYQAYLATNNFTAGTSTAYPTNNETRDWTFRSIVAAKTNYTDRLEATNSSTLTLYGGGIEAALESGQFKVRSPYNFSGSGSGLTDIPTNAIDSTFRAWVLDQSSSGISSATATNIVDAKLATLAPLTNNETRSVTLSGSTLTVGGSTGSNMVDIASGLGFVGADGVGFVFDKTNSTITVPSGVSLIADGSAIYGMNSLTNNHSAAVTLMDSLTLGKQLTAGPYAVTAGTYTGIHGGLSNRITSGLYSFIAGGLSNTLADFVGSFILGGSHNTAKGAPINVSILNGSYNMMDGPDYSLIGGGWSNTVMNGYFTTILNGQNNYIGLSAPSPNIGNATILGGISNNLTAPGTWAMGNYLTNSTTNTIDVGLSDDTKTTFSASGVHMRSSLLTVGDAIGSNVINLSGDQGFIGAGQAGFVFRDTTSSIHVPGGVEFSGTNIAVGTIPSNRLAFAVATPTQVADATNASSIRAITAQQTNQAAILALTAQQTNYATLITMLGPLTNGLGGGAIGGTYQWTNDVNADGNNLYELATIYGSSNSSALTLTGSSAAQDNAISIYRTNSGNGISYFSQIGHEFSGPVSFVDGVGNISAGTLAATGNVTATGTSNYVAALHTDVLSLSELNAAQFNATNTVFVGNARYATNAAVIAPNFALSVQLWATNAAFTFGLPININRTNFESCVVFVTNSTAAAVSITPPAAVKTQGTWYCTNVSTFTFSHYGGLWTNAVALPLW